MRRRPPPRGRRRRRREGRRRSGVDGAAVGAAAAHAEAARRIDGAPARRRVDARARARHRRRRPLPRRRRLRRVGRLVPPPPLRPQRRVPLAGGAAADASERLVARRPDAVAADDGVAALAECAVLLLPLALQSGERLRRALPPRPAPADVLHAGVPRLVELTDLRVRFTEGVQKSEVLVPSRRASCSRGLGACSSCGRR